MASLLALLAWTPSAIAGDAANLLFPLDGSFSRVDFFGDGCTGNRCAVGTDQHNDDDSATVQLGFNFDLYGEQYATAYVNNNGNLSFGQYFSTFSSSGFPTTSFKMVAGFWADIDTGTSSNFIGDVWQKLSSNTLVVIWDNVGYFSQQADKRNTFEIAISDGTNPAMGLGNNVCLSYDDMQWTTGGSSGGSGGFGGTPATVGANRGNGSDFFQIGRFDHDGLDYDGPTGLNDGVSYLDRRLLCFRTGTSTTNIAPIATGFPAGNSVRVDALQSESLSLPLSFLSPEAGQTTSVDVTDVDHAMARGLEIGSAPGNVAEVDLDWTPTCADVGLYAVDFVAQDDFEPAGETRIRLTIHVVCEPVEPTATPTPSPTPPPGCMSYSASAGSLAIPDLGEVTSSIFVEQAGVVGSVSVVGLHGTHGFVQDLEFTLTSPDGASVVILEGICGGAQDFNLTLDDLAATVVSCPPTDGLVHLPSHPLAPLAGQSARGNWVLKVEDTALMDTGTLDGWGLLLCLDAPSPLPSPTPTRTRSVTPTSTASASPTPTSSPSPTRTASITATVTSSPTPSAMPGCETFFAGDVPQRIPDLGMATSTILVDSPGVIRSISLLQLRGKHSFTQDLEFHLRSPNGVDVGVIDRVCGGADDFDLGLDDLSPLPISCPPTDGYFHRPSSSLASFQGLRAGGVWSLDVVDRALDDDGILEGWGLQVCTDSPKPTHTPAPTFTPTAAPACAEVYATDGSIGATIPDLGTLRSQLFIPLSGRVEVVAVRALAGVHPYMQDLEFHLISPSGTDVTVVDRVCGGADGFQLELDDLGVPIACPPFDPYPHLPSRPLSSFIDEAAGGIWTLDIYDRALFDEGTLLSWGLYVCAIGGSTPTPTPSGATSPTRTSSPSPSRTITGTRTPSHTPTLHATPTPTSSIPPSPTNSPTVSPTYPPTPTGTRSPSPTPIPTSTPTRSPTITVTVSPSASPTATRPPKLTFTPTLTPTTTATGSRTIVPASTPTATSTGSPRPPKLTFTPTRTPTRSPTMLTPTATLPPTGCGGDCDRDGYVSIAELASLIESALGDSGASSCRTGDRDGDGVIRIDELVAAVNQAKEGCSAASTPTPSLSPTRTSSPTPSPEQSPTPSRSPGSDVARPATGAAIVIAQSLRAIPAVISSLTQLARSGSSAAQFGRAAKSCSAGGARDFVCTQQTPGTPPRDYSLSFSSCGLNTANGGKVVVDGGMTGRSNEAGLLASCNLPPLVLSSMVLDGVRVQVRSQTATTLDATFNLDGSAMATADLFSSCRISAFEMTVSGNATVVTGGLSVAMSFRQTTMKVAVEQFSADCVPLRYSMTVNGPLTLTTSSFGEFSATYSNFVLRDDSSSGADSIRLDGNLQSTCLAAPVTYITDSPLSLITGSACPTGGTVRLSASGRSDKVEFTVQGGVAIDRENNGSVDERYAACVDAELRACGE